MAKLTKDDKRVIKLLQVMMHFKMDFTKFIHLKNMHSLVYILQSFGMDLGYKFDWYIFRPGCPLLTKDLIHVRGIIEENFDIEVKRTLKPKVEKIK